MPASHGKRDQKRPTSSDQKLIRDYAEAFTRLQPDNIGVLLALVDLNVRFCDPFNDVHGRAAFSAIFEHMFKTTQNPKFTVTDIAFSSADHQAVAYLRWKMTGHTKGWPSLSLSLSGMSEIHLAENGLVSAHIDHWDSASQLLAKLPLIGGITSGIMRIFAVKTKGH